MIKIGFGLTALWSIGLTFLIYEKWSDVLNMSLANWGGFLSGATAPVAFLWLVLGYLMQNAELKMNRETLKAQTEALIIQAEAAKIETDEIRRQQTMRVFGSNWENLDKLDRNCRL